MNNTLHTVLGASGAIGRAVVRELQFRNLPVRTVERQSAHPQTTTVEADLLKPDDARKSIAGSSHVYLCIGLPYRADVWQVQWPLVMENVIDACAESGANLIFFDNVYLYGPPPLRVPFDENHPQQPVTKKGMARRQTAEILLRAFASGKVNGLIGRAADFYGPYAVNSPFYISFLERMLHGKSPQSLFPLNVKHTYAYTTNLGQALVMLALDPSTYQQVWHLPVGEPITIHEVTDMFNRLMGTAYRTSFLPELMQQALSIVIPPIREVREMKYQFESPYIMSYEKFRNHFPDFRVTRYEDGIRSMIESFQQGASLQKNI
jgi:nucleoside-diphosphate-sugar epimerase